MTTDEQMAEIDEIACHLAPEVELRLERMADSANEAEIRWLIGEWLTEIASAIPHQTDAMAEAAAWVAEGLGYPVEVRFPDRPIPRALWGALVDHIHADATGDWHANTLDREDTESWLADEAGRVISTPGANDGE